MIFIDMQNELERISIVFGKKYHDEIVKLFWKEFNHISIGRFKALVDSILYQSRYYPTISDFIKANTELRFKEYEVEKKKVVDEINAIWPQKAVSQDKANEFFTALRKSLTTGVPFDGDKFDFALPNPAYNCKRCKDTGDIYAKHKVKTYTYLFACRCESGIKKQSTDVDRWNDKLFQHYDIV